MAAPLCSEFENEPTPLFINWFSELCLNFVQLFVEQSVLQDNAVLTFLVPKESSERELEIVPKVLA